MNDDVRVVLRYQTSNHGRIAEDHHTDGPRRLLARGGCREKPIIIGLKRDSPVEFSLIK